MKRFLFIFAFVLLFSYPAYAEEVICGTDYKVNPIYEYLNIEYAQLYDIKIGNVSYEECTDFEDAHNYIVEQAKLRNDSFSFCYPTDISIMASHEEKKTAILSEAIELFESMGDYSEFDKNGAESDYIYRQWFNRSISYSYLNDTTNRIAKACITFNIVWFTTPQQIAEEDAKVKEILDELNIYDEDEYTQVKAVYDYVMDNAVYVSNEKYEAAEEAGKHPLYHSSYSALVMGETVCQGYATAIYRLLRELGISCRVVTGDSTGGPHAWNMVRIGSYYYLIDATWDDQPIEKYNYFLKASYNNHFPDEEFKTTEFKRFFPMAEEDYSEPLEYIPNAPSNITITGDGEETSITFDLDYTAQYAYVERNGEIVYLEENTVDDKTTHTFNDTPPGGDVTYEISSLRAEYNSRTEEETHHFNTVTTIHPRVLSIEVENTEDNTLKAVLYHNDARKEGKLFVVVSRGEKTEAIYNYNPADKIEFTYEKFTSECKVRFMWIDLATMKPLSENIKF